MIQDLSWPSNSTATPMSGPIELLETTMSIVCSKQLVSLFSGFRLKPSTISIVLGPWLFRS